MGSIEKSLVILKPDAVRKKLIGKILLRIEKLKLELKDLKYVNAGEKELRLHYKHFNPKVIAQKSIYAGYLSNKKLFTLGKDILTWNEKYMQSGKILLLVFEGKGAIDKIRKIIGNTDCAKAKRGTIRGDLGRDSLLKATLQKRGNENLIHASSTKKEAKNEIKIWFPKLR